jgi:hypothetical protein
MVIGNDKNFPRGQHRKHTGYRKCRMMILMFYTPHQALFEYQMKEGDMGRANERQLPHIKCVGCNCLTPTSYGPILIIFDTTG